MIVEDDITISSMIKEHLEKWNYEVFDSKIFNNIIEDFIHYSPDLVLLEIYLPLYNGYHWCEKIRQISQIPIIFISSANENMNIIMAMNMGGDDFITKPFDLNVLISKIQAILRRTYSFSKEFHILSYQDVYLNLLDATVSYRDQIINLTKNELKILQLLFERPQTIISRDELMNHLWQNNQFVDDNTLSVNMNRLRKKLEEIGLKSFIVTKKGLGYILC
jgi:Response regulators consisting of a CheY-like receiver domain and a winged-helix DNA-binding domain